MAALPPERKHNVALVYEIVAPRMRPVASPREVALAGGAGPVWLKLKGVRKPVLAHGRLPQGMLEAVEAWAPHLVTDDLTNREAQVFMMLAQGWRAAAIARRLGIAKQTLSTYRERIVCRTGMTTDAEFAVCAHVQGLTRWPFEDRA